MLEGEGLLKEQKKWAPGGPFIQGCGRMLGQCLCTLVVVMVVVVLVDQNGEYALVCVEGIPLWVFCTLAVFSFVSWNGATEP